MYRALERLGGTAERHEIKETALALADFSPAQLSVPAPPSKISQYPNRIEYELSWALTHLGKAGLVERVAPRTWRITADR